MGDKRKRKTSFSLSAECLRLLALLSRHLGLSMASVIELLIRKRARQEGVVNESHQEPQNLASDN